ncbi:MAG: rod shape-determining protein MreD [Actinomycetota bacterium]|nr:rod shape-determining protein MreD [Actinomycetota bacterium]
MTASNWARLFLICVVAFILQVGLVDQVVVAGYHADVMVLLAAGAGLIGGPQRGAVTGFVAGLLADLALPTPYGLSALTFVLVGFTAGLLAAPRATESLLARGLTCLVCGAAGTLLYAFLAALIGQSGMLTSSTLEATVAVAAGGLVLSWPSLVALSWAFATPRGLGDRHVVPSGGSATL